MPNTYVALATQTLATAASSVTFNLSGISGYTDLVLVMNALQTSPSVNQTRIRVGNSSIDSGSNYSQTILYGNGTSALSTRASNQSFIDFDYMGAPGISGNPNIIVANFMNYSNTTTNKTILHRSGQATTGTDAIVSLWRSTAVINLINVFTSSGNNWTVGTTFNLYGIANADQGAAKATGGIITEDSQYWYHTFGASGAFVPKQSLTCDVLVVAGGGGGFGNIGGAGGASLTYQSGASFSVTSHTVTVGGGGPDSTAGTASSVNSISATGGATGFTNPIADGNANNGRGGAGKSVINGTTTNYTGGAGYYLDGSGGGTRLGGGGGSSAANGGAASNGTRTGGNGANGTTDYSSWGLVTGVGQNVSGTVYFAGGGAGGGEVLTDTKGTPGLGGGGAAGLSNSAVVNGQPGTINTGGGGGGGGGKAGVIGSSGGIGGSGVIIIRYSK
jgi:hypothetical protein